jgi:type I restriction enzyme R subunit
MDKTNLTETDICDRYISPAIEKAGWDKHLQIFREVFFTDGKIYVRGRMTGRGKRKRSDYVLFFKPNIPLAIVEAKKATFSFSKGIQQALDYASILDVPFVFSSNGEGFLFHDKTATDEKRETILSLEDFPSPETLWAKYQAFKGIKTPEAEKMVSQDYFIDTTDRKPRYYQQIAINRTIEAIAKGQNRLLLVMATGTGKTYTAFQIIYRLWKAKAKKRILFLADRTALIHQTHNGDFSYFKDKMTIVKNREVDKSYEIYLALYQGLSGNEDERNIYKQFSPEFFDLIVIDECHRGSAKEDSSWREILTYFHKATHIGLTATPKETKEVSNIEYFGNPIYIYSLKQGIEDGFLAPYQVLKVGLNIDVQDWRPEQGKTDIRGELVEDRVYNLKDYEKNLVIKERTESVAKKITEFLKGYDRFAKTIVFCVDINHAERMRTALINLNADLVAQNDKYIMQITGDNEEGKRELDNFTSPKSPYPVIVTTSELMTTGIDAQTCKVIVLDTNIQSMTKFKQIIGRGTRIKEEYGKRYFTILDFRKATDLFADKDFDGDPVLVKTIPDGDPVIDIAGEPEGGYDTVIDGEEGDEIIFSPIINFPIFAPFIEKRRKVYVEGVDVSVLYTQEIHFDNNGKPITLTLSDHTKEIIKGKYATLNDFLNKWNESKQKEAIIAELKAQGLNVEALYTAVNNGMDLFDLICHLAYGQAPLTRKERANQVKKRNYFAKYSDKAQKVLAALLEKYADEGVENIESLRILNIQPFNEFGSLVEIVKTFGGKEAYLAAVAELEEELYRSA